MAEHNALKARYASWTPEKVVQRLEKTRASINALIARIPGTTLANTQAQALVDRYNMLRESLLQRNGDERWIAWLAYCAKHGADWKHDGYDLFA